ncbi:Ldh family oxidoreductase [Pseudoruegeria sp. SHC-113]|uniref:Ldh family oxidoreductase n=1 Tax=Pseudoruegeria sp. SHC-113 TaxID=2855439 RepID=UPI0021BA7BFF|nr:Ldh family oxidoreductase [Pseudoruegeria sp. SHC-113]MCT8159486.1 Ldh family oxidoreductase [Pseudoruegeria sp. SHC-113]
MSESHEILSLAEAEALIASALAGVGVAAPAAASVARALVAAEAEGQVGHGFSRLADYAAQVQTGKVDGAAVPICQRTAPGRVEVDAAHGFAYPALEAGITALIEAAQAAGTASLAIRRSHHCGALSVQVEKLAQAGLVGLMVANAPAAMAPFGAKTPVFGTNPIAFAVPRPGKPPLVIDLSLSRVARGKVMHAKKSGQPIPEGWALDAEGQPTTDAEAALTGTMLPIGEAKGTALALMVEILAASFTGANASPGISSFFTADGPPPGAGQFLLALQPADAAGFATRLEALLSLIEGAEGARLPGTRRIKTLARAQAEGIAVPKAYVEQARALAGLAPV